jgi:hypothetical protein
MSTTSKVATLITEADKAYDAVDQAWFEGLPTEDLTALWGVACATDVSWDDEVYDALDKRGWFEQAVKSASKDGATT